MTLSAPVFGERFATRARTITEADVVAFAALTWDQHPLHTDAALAAHSPFGERVAHGMLILSYAVGLVPLDPDHVVALRGVSDAVFKAPVRLGDTIHVEGTVEHVRALGDGLAVVRSLWRIVNDRGELVARARFEVLWREEPSALETRPTAEVTSC
jgi:3-hydroxybutyryl-CoA dehydratase